MSAQLDIMTGRIFFKIPEASGTAFPKPRFCVQGIIMEVGRWIVNKALDTAERTQMSLWIR